ncbi:MAG: putative glycolipid-binding domain-containing protein [Flavobacterium sp.]
MHHICWKAIENDTIEDCRITATQAGYAIQSSISGKAEGKVVDADYEIATDSEWQVVSLSVQGRIGDVDYKAFMQNNNGQWTDAEGNIYTEFDGFKYIDITLTPLTNTLPVNNLKLGDGESAEINVVYIDVLERKIYPDRQKYTKISDFRYKFENSGGAFTADIEFDRNGFVTYYPQLFNRK